MVKMTAGAALCGTSIQCKNVSKHTGKFDHCEVTNARLFLNEKYYPYDNLNLDYCMTCTGIFKTDSIINIDKRRTLAFTNTVQIVGTSHCNRL